MIGNVGKHALFVFALGTVVPVWAAEGEASKAQYDAAMAELCAENSAPIRRQQGTSVFSWVDDNGVTHFGDRPPQNVDASEQSIQGKRDYFDVSISFPTGDTSVELRDSMLVRGQAIAHALSRLLPKSRMTKSTVAIQVFDNAAAFHNYRRDFAPGLSSQVVGFYSALENTVAVLHSGDDDFTVEIALHEATHVFQYKNIGMMPGWLSEGLATYFEMMEVKGQSKVVPASSHWLAQFRSTRQYVPLRDLLTADYGYFQSGAGAHYYGNAWALVYFLMLPENRAMFEQYLAIASQDKCDDEPAAQTVAFFEQAYPGGLSQMEAHWLDWLRRPHHVPNYH